MKDITSKNLKDTAQYIVIFVLVFGMIYLIIYFTKIEIPEKNRDIMMALIGVFTAKFSDGVAFLLNSSKGSAEKSETIAKLPPLPDSEADIKSIKVETTEIK